MTEKNGRAIADARVSGRFIRPADSKLDQTFSMQHGKAGVYQVELILPVPGKWELLLNIKQGDALHEIRAGTEIQK